MNELLVLTARNMLEAAVIALVFIVALFIGSKVLPGRRVELSDSEGVTRNFRLNGATLLVVTLIVVAVLYGLDWLAIGDIQTRFFELFIVANVIAFVLSGFLFWKGQPSVRNSVVYDFFFGRDLNPVYLGIDLKFFSYRPSLIALAIFNISFAIVQFETYGRLSLAMALYQVFTLIYVVNYFQFEYGMVHTWDIVSERFGWMLIWGDYVLVPFFYCIGGWWLIHAQNDLTIGAAIGLIALFAFGFWMFRGANQQKHRFKRQTNIEIWGKPAEALDGRLLVSGFWGIGRHLNYTGEICIYLAFTLTIGFESWIPYLLPIWLTCLLVHRSIRDERRCREKYGELWERYTQRVRFAMVPYVY
ncbi:MAG: DUF1295 domain-containing protein [Gammaproteobacteria bacterium]|nr:DUF1295 domain-containing protein [Gammaproteobacteria bacterium]